MDGRRSTLTYAQENLFPVMGPKYQIQIMRQMGDRNRGLQAGKSKCCCRSIMGVQAGVAHGEVQLGVGYSGYQWHRNHGTAFLTTLSREFPKEEFLPPHGCQCMGIVHALILLNAERHARKQHVPFLKSLVWLGRGLNQDLRESERTL